MLERREDERLEGVYETAWLDFKGTYHFENSRQRWEFGKDVVALANSGGGAIVVGVHTLADSARDEEFASKVVPVPNDAFEVTRARHFLDQDVYPPIEGVDIRVFPREEGGTHRVVAVIVPQPDPDLEPFLLTKTLDEESQSWPAFALPRRSGTHTVFQRIGLIHRDIADGRRRRVAGTSTGGRADGPRGLEPSPPVAEASSAGPPGGVEAAEEWTRGVADFLDKALGVAEVPMLYLAAAPADDRPRPSDFFAQSGFRQALSPRHTLRQNGFGLTYGQNVQVGGRSLMSVDEDRTVLHVDVGGRTVNGAAGTPDHLGWSYDRSDREMNGRAVQRINVVALNEFVLEFCRFVDRELASRWGRKGWYVVSMVKRAQSAERVLGLPAGYTRNAGWMHSAHPAETEERVEGFLAELEPERDAAMLLESIYGVFGLRLDADPFVVDGRFDVEKLLAL